MFAPALTEKSRSLMLVMPSSESSRISGGNPNVARLYQVIRTDYITITMPRTKFRDCVGKQMRGKTGTRSQIRAEFRRAVTACKGGKGRARSASPNGRRSGCRTAFQQCMKSEMKGAHLKGSSQSEIRSQFRHSARVCAGSRGSTAKHGNPRPKTTKRGIFGLLG